MGKRGSWSEDKYAVELYERRYLNCDQIKEIEDFRKQNKKITSLTKDPIALRIDHDELSALLCRLSKEEKESTEEFDGLYADCYWFMLKIALLLTGASQAELCEIIGRHKSYIPTLAKNHIRPSDELERKIYELTGCYFMKPGVAPFVFKEFVLDQRYDSIARFNPIINGIINASIQLDYERLQELACFASRKLKEKKSEDAYRNSEYKHP